MSGSINGAVADLASSLVGGPAAELEWQDQALCAQTDPEQFFPEKGGSTREAKRTCMRCDVRLECLDYALANGERFGIWGGLSERERRRIEVQLHDAGVLKGAPARPAADDEDLVGEAA